MRPIDGYSGDTESQDDENDDWRIFHDQASQLRRDARQAKFVLEKEDRATGQSYMLHKDPRRAAPRICRSYLSPSDGCQPRSDRDVSSPDHSHETQHAVNGMVASRYATSDGLLRLSATKDANLPYALDG